MEDDRLSRCPECAGIRSHALRDEDRCGQCGGSGYLNVPRVPRATHEQAIQAWRAWCKQKGIA